MLVGEVDVWFGGLGNIPPRTDQGGWDYGVDCGGSGEKRWGSGYSPAGMPRVCVVEDQIIGYLDRRQAALKEGVRAIFASPQTGLKPTSCSQEPEGMRKG